jgi:hypothetical protein
VYGQQSMAAGGTATVVTAGLDAAWYVTAVIGLVFASIAVLQLVRRPGRVRP